MNTWPSMFYIYNSKCSIRRTFSFLVLQMPKWKGAFPKPTCRDDGNIYGFIQQYNEDHQGSNLMDGNDVSWKAISSYHTMGGNKLRFCEWLLLDRVKQAKLWVDWPNDSWGGTHFFKQKVIPLLTDVYASQMVQGFFHQQYEEINQYVICGYQNQMIRTWSFKFWAKWIYT